MPLTFAHPAAVLPLLRGPLVPSALVAGAMSPDVPYFLRATPVPVSAQSWYEPAFNGTTTHGWPGLLTVAVPLALLLHVGWLAARRPLAAVLGLTGPSCDGSPWRAPGRSTSPLATTGWAVLSAVVGVGTHVVWDAFTHGDGFVASRLPVMDDPVVADLTWVRALQHLSTVAGLTVLVVFAWRRRRSPLVPGRGRRQLTVLAVVAAVGALGAGAGVLGRPQDRPTGVSRAAVEELLFDAVTGGGVALLLAAVLGAACWWLLRLADRGRGRRP